MVFLHLIQKKGTERKPGYLKENEIIASFTTFVIMDLPLQRYRPLNPKFFFISLIIENLISNDDSFIPGGFNNENRVCSFSGLG